MMFKQDLVKATGAVVLKDEVGEEQKFQISTDTRKIESSDIYLPLKGANFNGENFIDNDNIFAYFTTGNKITERAKLVLKVENTLEAYLKLAQYYLKQQKGLRVVGITGSSGKTTTKELVYSVLSQKFKTHKTFSNHNNEIGFCQTVFSMASDTEVLIVEMGMRGLGEIELISKHLQPDYAVITNSGSAHIGRLGSLDNIAIAKCEITTGLNQNGVFIANNQDIIKKHVNFDGQKEYYSINDVTILEKAPSYSKFSYKGNTYELNVEGDYNIENALAAINLGIQTGMSYEEICKGLISYRPIEKRWEVENINGLKFINDSYNANPDSMKASVKTFVELYKNPVVILGNMGELGENEIEYHREVGKYLANINTNQNVKYITIGNLAKHIGEELSLKGFEVKNFDNNSDTARYILANLDNSYTIFLKASRSMKFEEILENIKRGI
ncbi:UDP-N-acetylmuramoyl-tripeptide--D-alanyl-D-alanine ligase [bacterium]|nr:UDP-N-acetylmuramoyl-tripeptide--D-alanyl-D-alanine ligase [bacterium]